MDQPVLQTFQRLAPCYVSEEVLKHNFSGEHLGKYYPTYELW